MSWLVLAIHVVCGSGSGDNWVVGAIRWWMREWWWLGQWTSGGCS